MSLKVKPLSFPSYEEWTNLKKRDWTTQVGAYYIRIANTGWQINGPTYYAAAISTHPVPTNIYAKCIIYLSHNCMKDEGLEDWYNKTCKELNQSFEKFIRESYLVTEEEEK